MEEKMAEKAMQIILYAGNSKSSVIETMNKLVEDGDVEAAKEGLKAAGKELGNAHEIQTQLLFDDMNGKINGADLGILMVHAQDHFMNAVTIRDMGEVMVKMYEKLSK